MCKSAVEKAREELREAVREQAEKAREAARRGLAVAIQRERTSRQRPADAPASPVKSSRHVSEVRQMEQQLRQAMRRLQAIERATSDVRSRRRWYRPHPPTEKPPVAPPAPPEVSSARPAPPAKPEPPAPPNAPRPLRRPGGFPGERLGSGYPRRPGMAGPGRAAVGLANPRVERRLRDLEDKMDRLLKELESLKGEKKDKDRRPRRKQREREFAQGPGLAVASSKCEGRRCHFLIHENRGFEGSMASRRHGHGAANSPLSKKGESEGLPGADMADGNPARIFQRTVAHRGILGKWFLSDERYRWSLLPCAPFPPRFSPSS